MMGRDFTAADNTPGAEKVALIGYGIWQRDFGGAADIVGTVVRINGKPATIIGVMPKGFAFPTNEELWIPLYSEFPPRPRNDPRAISPAVLGLLKPGVSLDQANAEFTRHRAAGSPTAYPDTNKQFNTGQVEPLIKTFTPRAAARHAADDARLLRRRAAHRVRQRDEHAVRAGDAARAGAGGPIVARRHPHPARPPDAHREPAASRASARWSASASRTCAIDWLSATVRNLDNPPPSWITFDVDALVLAVTVGATIVAAVVSGLLPAWMSSRANAIAVLRDSGRGTTSRRMTLVIARPRRLPDRRHLRAADRLAAAGAVDPQAADDRLRLRHRAA